jgi:hypothetical protein
MKTASCLAVDSSEYKSAAPTDNLRKITSGQSVHRSIGPFIYPPDQSCRMPEATIITNVLVVSHVTKTFVKK